MTWEWKPTESTGSTGLLYEPGNWGDVIKGLWVVEVASALLAPGEMLRYADPFAGAYRYPLVAGAAERMQALSGHPLGQLQRPAIDSGHLFGSAGLVIQLARQRGADLRARLFELDEERRRSFEPLPEVELLPVGDGWQALAQPESLGEPDLLLVDPYDLDHEEHWRGALDGLTRAHRAGAHLLLYYYNRSPRNPNHFKRYRTFRETLAEQLNDPALVLGRVPTDSLLARAWHEMILLPSPAARLPLPEDLAGQLIDLTETLAWGILRPGCSEQVRSSE